MSKVKSFQQKKETVKRNWHVVDVEGKVLGRIATEIASLLMGKHKPTFTTHVDTGDYVIILNASKVVVTGKKESDKIYYSHSLYPGGFKQETFDKLLARDPKQVIEKAVYGMLSKNKLRPPRMKRLKIFAGAEHTFQSNVGKTNES